MPWQSSLESVKEFEAYDHPSVTDTTSPEFMQRVDKWRRWVRDNGRLPPGLVTADGMLVDGHHRIRVARMRRERLPCCVVESTPDGWRATGAVAFCW